MNGALETFRHHSRTFSLAAAVFPPAQRESVAQLYAFCRYLDDCADRPAEDETDPFPLERAEADLRAGHSTQPAIRDFLRMADAESLPMEAALRLVRTLREDRRTERILLRDRAELIRYGYGAAGTVGLLLCPLLGAPPRRAAPFAADLGIALQLTNICRDVLEDARMGRIYLPRSEFPADCDPWAAIAATTPATRGPVENARLRVLDLAEHYYRSAATGYGLLPPRPRLAVALAAGWYRAIGARIRAAEGRFLTERPGVASSHKARLAPRLALAAATAKLRHPDPVHDARLHEPLDTGATHLPVGAS